MGKKCSDEQVIKALEVVRTTANCNECAFYGGKVCNCSQVTAIYALDLIKRQQTEIERYKGVIRLLEKDVSDARAEAVREFVARLKNKLEYFGMEKESFVSEADIDELVKEMTEENALNQIVYDKVFGEGGKV